MKTAILAILVTAGVGLCPVSAQADWNGPIPLGVVIEQTNVTVNDGCSGTVISVKDGYVLTAEHCVTQQYRSETIEVEEPDGTLTTKKVRKKVPGFIRQKVYQDGIVIEVRTLRMEVIKRDKGKDLALVRVLGRLSNLISSPIACGLAQVGSEVFTIGNPLGLENTMTRGYVSHNNRTEDSLGIGSSRARMLQVSSGLAPGNSGGASYNSRGEIIGVASRAARGYETYGFIIASVEIVEFLKQPVVMKENQTLHLVKRCIEGD